MTEAAVAENPLDQPLGVGPNRRIRYPVPVIVVRGPNKGGVVLGSDGRAYVFVPEATEPGRVVGAVAVTESGAAGAAVSAPSQAAVTSVDLAPAAQAGTDQGRPADHEGSQEAIAEQARAEFRTSSARTRRAQAEAIRSLRAQRHRGLAGH